jgi:hypothetical protein
MPHRLQNKQYSGQHHKNQNGEAIASPFLLATRLKFSGCSGMEKMMIKLYNRSGFYLPADSADI